MSDSNPTLIGRVRHVLGSQVTVQLDDQLAGVAPVFRGELQSVGQIGSLVRIPQGLIDLVATVTLVGIAELTRPPEPTNAIQAGERWLQIQLLGEIDRATGTFGRGVSSYPGLDDEVHFTVVEDLAAIYPAPANEWIRLGTHAASRSIGVTLDAGRLVTRHSAVVGSTGAGKTSAVATIVQSFANGDWPSANVVVIDSHGEYARALDDHASVRSVLGTGANELKVPYWALPAVDILRAFASVEPGPTVLKAFESLVVQERLKFLATCSWLELDPATVTPDTPIPFDIYEVWYRLDRDNRETRSVKGDPATERLVAEGNAASLKSAEFETYAPAGGSPFQAPTYGLYSSVPELLRNGLKDPRLGFLRDMPTPTDAEDPLPSRLNEWLGGEKPISVLDFSGVPIESTDLAVGVVLQLIFEVAIRTRAGEDGIGRPRPVLVVLEEAHRYLSEGSAEAARISVNRIAREGRKYGVGLMLVTQRPSELPDTALSQCGTLIALRLSNSADQARIRSALPDNVSGLAEALPSLRTGEAIVSGEAIVLPSRVLIDRPDPLPQAEDPDLMSWRVPTTVPTVSVAIERWRGSAA